MNYLTPQDCNSDFHIALLNPESESIYTVLGITEERSDEIIEIAKKAYKNHKLFTSSLHEAIAQMNHINEVAYCVMFLSKIHRGDPDSVSEKLQLLKMLLTLQKGK